jgi:hypothetical protein
MSLSDAKRRLLRRLKPQVFHVMRTDDYDFYGGRPNPKVPSEMVVGWGNPFPLVAERERGATLGNYVLWLIQEHPEIIKRAQKEQLHKKRGACWCAGADGLAIDDPLRCHLQVLMRAARGDYDEWIERLRL